MKDTDNQTNGAPSNPPRAADDNGKRGRLQPFVVTQTEYLKLCTDLRPRIVPGQVAPTASEPLPVWRVVAARLGRELPSCTPPPRLTDAEREFYRWLIREELKKWVA